MEKYKIYCSNNDGLGYTAIVTGDEYEIEKSKLKVGNAYNINIKKNNNYFGEIFPEHIATIFCDHYEIKEWVEGEAWSKLVASA